MTTAVQRIPPQLGAEAEGTATPPPQQTPNRGASVGAKDADTNGSEGGSGGGSGDDQRKSDYASTGSTPARSPSVTPPPPGDANGEAGPKRPAPQSKESSPLPPPSAAAEEAKKKPEKEAKKKKEKPKWREVKLDAEELEGLLFSVRRAGARAHLQKLVTNLKGASEQIRRAELIRAHQEAQKRKREHEEAQKKAQREAQKEAQRKRKRDAAAVSGPRRRPGGDGPKPWVASAGTTDSGSSPATKKQKVNGNKPKTEAEKPAAEKELVGVDKSEFLVLPQLKEKDPWVKHHLEESEHFCPDFQKSHTCPLKAECDQLHIYRVPFTRGVDPTKNMTPYSREDLERAYKYHMKVPLQPKDFMEKIKPDDLNRHRYSSALLCPVNKIYYYSAGGKDGIRSDQGIWWYPEMTMGRDACATVVLHHLKEMGAVPKYFSGVQKKERGEQRGERGTRYSTRFNQAPSRPFSNALIVRQQSLPSQLPPPLKARIPPPPPPPPAVLSLPPGPMPLRPVAPLPPPPKPNMPPPSLPGNPSVFRGSSFGPPASLPGNRNDFQGSSNPFPLGLPGYSQAAPPSLPGNPAAFRPSPSKARNLPGNPNAVVAPYVPPTPDPSLPDVEPWNWMERSYSQRCQYFNSNRCHHGSNCKFAHVFHPTHIPTSTVPHQDALSYAYEKNFDIKLDDITQNPFCSTGVLDPDGHIWYAAAFSCPAEGTIYYAAGGPAGRINGQNMYLYPTAKDAISAVSGVVLNAFSSRGMHCSWEAPPQPAYSLDYEPSNSFRFGRY